MAKSLAHIAERKAFEKILDSIIKKSQTENVSDVFLSLVDKIEKIMGEDWEASSYEMLRQIRKQSGQQMGTLCRKNFA